MSMLTFWVIAAACLALAAAAGGIAVHLAEQAHWHRLAQTWHDDGYDAGWYQARTFYGTMVPDMVFTRDGTLEPAPPRPEPALAPGEALTASLAGLGGVITAARARLNLR